MKTTFLFCLLSVLAACSDPSAKQGDSRSPEGNPKAGDMRKTGTIRFDVSCRPELKADFEAAVALLHSFFYEEARRRFLEIAERDPQCAMAWWGVAMTWYHPLWAPPTPDEMKKGAEAVERAKKIGGGTDLEKGFIAAIDAFFSTDEGPAPTDTVAESCHGPRALSARAVCFRQGIERLRKSHPDNLEVKTFYALALLGTAAPTDKLYQNQLAAAALLESLAEKHPDHPGIPHYLIHAYDYPSLAAKGLQAARRYGEIAPWVPHALHMPSHIYTRMGMWKESIDSNLASAAAAREYSARFHEGSATNDELHALDYLEFAYLQTGQEAKAGGIVEHLRGIRKFFPEKDFAEAYAAGAIPARWTLERRRWADAAALETPHPGLLKSFPFAEAHIEFARAVGGARGGRLEVARAALGRLAELREALKEPKFQWWINQIEIQRLAGAGWLALADGHKDEAEARLREAAALEDKAGTHPVTPGQILPAREQLGDLLLELGRPADALVEYQKSLEAFPNRFHGHYGAGRSAERAGKSELARKHYEHLLEMSTGGEGWREERAVAQDFLSR
jgi:tetratricopeptide (TPR) repeat protein